MESRELIPGSEADIRVRTTSMEISILYYAHLHEVIEKNMQTDVHPFLSISGILLILHVLLRICALHIFRWSPCVWGTVT